MAGSARTTPRIRAELQLATGSHRSLAKLYGINPKTVAKWRARTSVLDEPMGPRGRASQHLSQEQELPPAPSSFDQEPSTKQEAAPPKPQAPDANDRT